MTQLRSSVTTEDSYTLVALAGEFDLNTSQTLRDVLEPHTSGPSRRLIVDLSGVAFIDSTAVHALLDIRAALAAVGGRLILVAPQAVVARVLNIVGADQLIPVCANLAEALAVAGTDPR